ENWEKHSVINLVDDLKPDELKIFIDEGIDDIFIDQNRDLHQKLLDLKIPHDYIERPGAHTNDYLRFTELEISLRFKIIKTCQRSIDGYRFRPIPIFGTDRF